MFMLVRVMNRLKREQPAPAVALITKDCPFCATAIPIKATRCPRRTSAFDARRRPDESTDRATIVIVQPIQRAPVTAHQHRSTTVGQ
jgi:hypothetical protein